MNDCMGCGKTACECSKSADTVTIPQWLFDYMIEKIKDGSTVGGGWWNDRSTWKAIRKIEDNTGMRLV